MTSENLLDAISIVLVKTSHPGNVGSTARAMKTMGLSRLVLVQPKSADICAQPEAIALASGAGDVLETAQVVSSLAEALDSAQISFALSARLRELGPVLQSPLQAATEAKALVSSGGQVAFVFGAERTGLSNEELLCCNRQVFIPSNPDYCSLNLSQAVQIVTYSLRLILEPGEALTLDGKQPKNSITSTGDLATADAVERLRLHWLEAMESVDFLNPDKPKKLVQRLGRLLGRAQLETTEVDMLRGFLGDVIRVANGRLYPHEQNRAKPKEE